jgi:hemerythrin superfamily protein
MADVVDLIKAQHRQVEALLEQAGSSGPERTVQVLRQVAQLLRPHSEAEESFVYPAIRAYDAREDEQVKDGAAEHHHIDALLAELLAQDPSGPGYDGKLAAMIGELRHHVEEEEQDLLPVLSEKASDEEREELGVRFAEVTDVQPEEVEVEVSKAQLYRRAKEQGVSGRSTMSKEELAKAVRGG